MSKYILALDQGTTSSRAIVFDRDGKIVSLAQQEFSQHYPQPGWVEHDANEIWHTQLKVARQVLELARLGADDIAAIGITNQRETTVVWDRRTGKPIANAIVWQDRRTSTICDELEQRGLQETIQHKTGLVVDAYFSGTKLRWILDCIPGARAAAERGELAFGTIDSWLVYNLTAGECHITDATNASRTMLYNLHTGEWDDELLEILRVPRAILPGVCGCSALLGHTSPDLFGKPIPIAGMAGDQQAALFGQACFDKGLVKNTYGTGCFMLMNIDDKPVASKHKLLTTVAWKIGERTTYALEGSVFIGGAVVQWLRDGLGIIKSSGDIEKLAAIVPDNGGVCFVPALVGLGAPHWDPDARGTITGLTRGSTAGHVARAALEGIAFQVADVLDAMREDSGLPITGLRADGGASANNLLMQTQADLLRVPVMRPSVTETTALGAAYLAGLAVGYWENMEEVRLQWEAERVFKPERDEEQVGRMRSQWSNAVKRSLTPRRLTSD
ncbi:MAG: glycerol kinase GlpK [Phycisphaera sp.]|nr:glycerol kinase GlpK [Phycisphaera sp.]